MALDSSASRTTIEKVNRYLLPFTLVALVFVFVGERIVVAYDWLRWIFSAAGMVLLVTSTAFRWRGAFLSSGERRTIERTLAMFSLVATLAMLVYFATVAPFRAWILDTLAFENRARVQTILMVCWVSGLLMSVLPLVFGEFALMPMRNAAHIESRRVRMATQSAMVLGFVAIYMSLFTFSAGKLDKKIDFSYYRTARPSESTQNVAKSLTAPVEVKLFFPALHDVGNEVQGYFQELSSKASNLSVTEYDRLLVPAIAKEAKVTQDGVIVLTKENARESITIGIDRKTADPKLKNLDSDFQKALLKLSRGQRTAYFTTGHGELNQSAMPEGGRSVKNFRKLVESQNYKVKDLGLTQGLGKEIPTDADLVAVLGPTQPFLSEEIEALKQYAAQGGHLLLALDPEAKIDLNPIAQIAGLQWSDIVLANDKVYIRRRNNNSDRSFIVTNRFSSHASVSTLSRNSQKAAIAFSNASSIEKSSPADSSLKIDFAVRSLSETFNDKNGNFEFDSADEKRSSYNLIAVVSRSIENQKEMRAFVLVDVDALSDSLFGNEPNIVLSVDAIRWLGGEESFTGAIATTEDVRIEHTKQKDVIWFYATIFGVPSMVAAFGMYIGRKTRTTPMRKSA